MSKFERAFGIAEKMNMEWIKPELVEINMSAEIGAYQGDSEEREVPFIAAGFESMPAVLSIPPVELYQ